LIGSTAIHRYRTEFLLLHCPTLVVLLPTENKGKSTHQDNKSNRCVNFKLMLQEMAMIAIGNFIKYQTRPVNVL